MSETINPDRVIHAVHALTGEWLSGDAAKSLAAQCSTRKELLAYGVSQLGWLAGNVPASTTLDILANAASIGSQQLDPDSVPQHVALPRTLSREAALALIERFSELPEEADPLDMLRELAARRSDQR